MPRTSHSTPESQRRAAHRRFHINRNIVKSDCEYCRQEHPECGAVEIELGSPEIKEPTVILLPPPPKEPIPDMDEWQRQRIYRLAALRRSVEEVSLALGMSPEEL